MEHTKSTPIVTKTDEHGEDLELGTARTPAGDLMAYLVTGDELRSIPITREEAARIGRAFSALGRGD